MSWLTDHVAHTDVLLVEDLDGDGAPEVAFADPLADRVGWVGPPPLRLHEVAGVRAPTDLRAADLDGDGDRDLVVADADGVWWLEQERRGDFVPHLAVAPYEGPVEVAIGELDRDGVPDLALTGPSGLSVALGTGSAFEAPRPVDFDGAARPSLADLDGDGDLDAVWVARAELVWAEGLGNGGFAARVSIEDRVDRYVVADLDGDGDVDLAWIRSDDGVRWAENRGDGRLRAASDLLSGPLAAGGTPSTGELDGLPGEELLVSVWDVVPGPTGPVYVAGRTRVWSWGGGAPSWTELPFTADPVVVADADGDGRTDVVAFGSSQDGVGLAISVRSGTRGGGFSAPVDWSDSFDARGVALAALDGDGRPDAVAWDGGGPVVGFAGGPTGGFEPGQSRGSAPATGGSFDAADFDGDGRSELVFAGTPWDLSGGGLRPSGRQVAGTLTAVGDVDLDGVPDVVDCSTTAVTRWDGGAWSTQPGVPASPIAGCRLVDLTGDGAPELVTWSAEELLVRSNPGDATFGTAQGLAFARAVTAVDGGDVDGDGDVDLVVAGGATSWVSRQDAGAFGAAEELDLAARALRVADLDLDGDDDVIAIDGAGRVRVLRQEGGVLAAAALVADLRVEPGAVDLGDADGDGDADLLVGLPGVGVGVVVNPRFSPPPPPDGHTGDPPTDDPPTGTDPGAHTGVPDEGPGVILAPAPCGCAATGSPAVGLGLAALAALGRRRAPRSPRAGWVPRRGGSS